MSLETNSANEIRANWLKLKFKLIIIIDLILPVHQPQNLVYMHLESINKIFGKI